MSQSQLISGCGSAAAGRLMFVLQPGAMLHGDSVGKVTADADKEGRVIQTLRDPPRRGPVAVAAARQGRRSWPGGGGRKSTEEAAVHGQESGAETGLGGEEGG